MDLSSLKNLDVKDLVSQLKGMDLLSNKKMLIKFGIVFVAILIFLIGYYAFISPIIKNQKEKIILMNENKNQIENFNNNIVTLSQTVKKLEPDFEKNNKLFHSKKEVEDLYQNISNFALANGLSIINLKKGEASGVINNSQNESGDSASGDQGTENSSDQEFIYFKIPVDYEISGNFLGYLKFRRALASSAKVINFDKEEINVLKEMQGQIMSKGTISIVGLPNEYN